MNSPNRPARPLRFNIRPLPTSNKGHMFLVALLIIAALPAALLTCIIWLPIYLWQRLAGKPSRSHASALHPHSAG